MTEDLSGSEVPGRGAESEEKSQTAERAETSENIGSSEREDALKIEIATIDPEAAVEQTREYAEAEAIESAIVETLDPSTPPTIESAVVAATRSSSGDAEDMPEEEVTAAVGWSTSGDADDRPTEELGTTDARAETMIPALDGSSRELADLGDLTAEALASAAEGRSSSRIIDGRSEAGDLAPSRGSAGGAAGESIDQASGGAAGGSASGAGEFLPGGSAGGSAESTDGEELPAGGAGSAAGGSPGLGSPEGSAGGSAAGEVMGGEGDSAGGAAGGDPEEMISVEFLGEEIHESPEGGMEVMMEVEETRIEGTETVFAQTEFEEIWEPPEMYMHVATDGTRTIVDASGNPLDSPPIYQLVVDGSGVEQVQATYPTGGAEDLKFGIPFYSAPLEGMSAHYGQDGTLTVVDQQGNPIKSPPILTKTVDASGVEITYATYPGMGPTQKIKLEAYSAPIEGMFAYKAADGETYIVDGQGNPIKSPPVVVSKAWNQEEAWPVVQYVGSEGTFLDQYDGTKAEVLEWYHPPIEGMYIHTGQDGTHTVVDSSGKAVESPPLLNIVVQNGVEQVNAYYKGSGVVYTSAQLSYYSAPLQNMYIHHGSDGSTTVVDQNGEPIDSPPIIQKVMGNTGSVVYKASYPGAEAPSVGTLSSFSAPITDMYAHVGQDGTITVVDEDGVPIESPPLITKLVEGGKEVILAYYPGDATESKPVSLSFYIPPSSK